MDTYVSEQDWLADAIIDDRSRARFKVHRRNFTDDRILALERQRIFDRCWLYLGHVSAVRNPSDFVTRKVAGRQLIFNHDKAGALHAYFNS